MTIPAPIRSGFRVGVDETFATYAHPPLVESWLCVDFVDGDRSFDWPTAELHAALGPEWIGAWTAVPESIVPGGSQLSNVMGDRALRLTSRGIAYGWLGYGGERYPRYESVRDGFVEVLDVVQSLTSKTNVTAVPKKWCVCYANRIPQGTVWSNPDDWKFFSLWQPMPLRSLGIDSVGARARWELMLEAERGTLTVEFRHDQSSTPDSGECVWIVLRTEGPLEDGDSDLFDGLDYGREVIVRTFNELVSPAAKAFWGVAPRPR